MTSSAETEWFRAYVKAFPTEFLIAELHRRGVSVVDIFGAYYAMDEEQAHREDLMYGREEDGHHGDPKSRPRLTVEDAVLINREIEPTVLKEPQL